MNGQRKFVSYFEMFLTKVTYKY